MAATGSRPPWLHPLMKRDEAERALFSCSTAKGDGTFLVREKDDATSVLSIILEGAPKHVLIKRQPSGFLFNDTIHFNVATLEDVIATLQQTSYPPFHLRGFVPCNAASEDSSEDIYNFLPPQSDTPPPYSANEANNHANAPNGHIAALRPGSAVGGMTSAVPQSLTDPSAPPASDSRVPSISTVVAGAAGLTGHVPQVPPCQPRPSSPGTRSLDSPTTSNERPAPPLQIRASGSLSNFNATPRMGANGKPPLSPLAAAPGTIAAARNEPLPSPNHGVAYTGPLQSNAAGPGAGAVGDFPAFVPSTIRCTIKSEHSNVLTSLLTMHSNSKFPQKWAYLVPKAVLLYDSETEERPSAIFELENCSHPVSIERSKSGHKLTVHCLATSRKLVIKDDLEQILKPWEKALNQAMVIQLPAEKLKLPLPKFFNAMDHKSRDVRPIIFKLDNDKSAAAQKLPVAATRAEGQESAAPQKQSDSAPRATNPHLREIYRRYLADESRHALTKHVKDLYSLFVGGQPSQLDTQAFMSFLLYLDRKPLVRSVVLGLELSSNFVQEFTAFVRDDTEWRPRVSLVDFFGHVQDKSQPGGRLLSLFVGQVEDLISDGQQKDYKSWESGLHRLIGYGDRFDEAVETAFHADVDNKVIHRLQLKNRNNMRLLSDIHAFRIMVLRECLTSGATLGGRERYLQIIRGLDEDEMQEVRPDPDVAGKILTIPATLVLADNLAFQLETVRYFAECRALQYEVFRELAAACIEERKMVPLTHLVLWHISSISDVVPDAPVALLQLIIARKDLSTSEIAPVIEMTCVLVGLHQEFAESLARWQPTPEDVALLRARLEEFVTRDSRFRKIMETNLAWFRNTPRDLQEQAAMRLKLQNSDPTTINFERSFEASQALLIGLFGLCATVNDMTIAHKWGQRLTPETFLDYMNDTIRRGALEALQRVAPNMLAGIPDRVLAHKLMNRAGFFSATGVNAINAPTAQGYDFLHERYYDLLQMADRLDEYDSFDLSQLEERRDVRLQFVLNLLQELTVAIDNQPDSVFQQARQNNTPIGINTLLQCALYGCDALFLLQKMRERDLLQGCIRHYLTNCQPVAWLGLFQKLDVIAFFIKFLTRESYPQAWIAFERRNANSSWAKALLGEAQRQFAEPLVSEEQLDSMLKMTDTAANELIEQVAARAQAAEESDMQFVYEFSAQWMRHMMKQMSIPMVPHNTQIITMLMFSAFYRLRARVDIPHFLEGRSDLADRFQTMIAEVGTGEGKSVIILMMALYFVVKRGQRVHVLENNISLRDRDYNNYKDFYSLFRNAQGQPVSVGTDPAGGADITYVLQNEIESCHLREAPKGKSPFAGMVLIADEVDDLIIDRQPTSCYVQSDDEWTPFAADCFQRLKERGSNATAPPNCPTKVWDECKSAYDLARKKKEGQDYGFFDDGYRILDSRGGRTTFTSTWLQFINYERGHLAVPTIDSRYYVISTAHLFRQYAFIVGVTGTVGGSAEREYLEKTYKAGVFSVPAFLDTCTDNQKREPEYRTVEVASNAEQQLAKVVQLAQDYSRTVPVLLIAQDRHQATKFFEAIKRRMGKEPVQLLLEYTVDGKYLKSEWQKIVDLATQPVPRKQPQQWRVLVTDYFGGRGQDFKVTDEGVDENGGMMVIITHIPDSRREWVQWKGRTARQDRKGQLAVVLDETEEKFLHHHQDVVRQFRDKQLTNLQFIDALLDCRNTEKQNSLATYVEGQKQGMAVAALCDRFYKKVGGATPWPGSQEKLKLRNFLEQYFTKPPLAETLKLARELGVDEDFPYINE